MSQAPDDRSPAQRLAALPPDQRATFFESLDPDEFAALEHLWRGWWARPKQLMPPIGAWQTWLVLAGRGWGKTLSAAQAVRELVTQHGYRHIGLIGRTAADVRDVMIEGPSGLLAIFPPHERPHYEPSKRRLTFANGAVATSFSADQADQLRGPQHDAIWCDELAAWRDPDAWDQAQFGLRLGAHPLAIVSTTPRPTPLLRGLLANSAETPTEGVPVVVTVGRTLENAANLPPSALNYLLEKYAGTRLGRQELDAELLLDAPGALWTLALIEQQRLPPSTTTPVGTRPASSAEPTVTPDGRVQPASSAKPDSADPIGPAPPDRLGVGTSSTAPVDEDLDLTRLVVAVDPPASNRRDDPSRAEAGIIVAGLSAEGHAYVLEDASIGGSPAEWARAALDAYLRWQADVLVAEVNNGGEMVAHTVQSVAGQRLVNIKQVRASRGKQARAEPVSALYERGLVHHVGAFPQLEDQLCTWVPGDPSPDRLDALVWAISELLLRDPHTPIPARHMKLRARFHERR